MKKLSISVIISSILLLSFSINESRMEDKETALFSFGVAADCQYADIDDKGERKYRLSKLKLEKCVNHYNNMNLEFVIHVGDFIDKDFSSFSDVQPIYEQLKMPGYHVLGNHDYDVADEHKLKVREALKLPSKYYEFIHANYRFIVLDGNELSFYAHPKESEGHQASVKYYEDNNLDAPDWNGGIGKEQLNWLEGKLKEASQENQKVMVFCHFPLYPNDKHNLWNAEELIAVFEKYPVVKAYMNGHNHNGNYGFKNGIHYINLKGMVDTDENSYATVDVLENKININGFGREDDRVLCIK